MVFDEVVAGTVCQQHGDFAAARDDGDGCAAAGVEGEYQRRGGGGFGHGSAELALCDRYPTVFAGRQSGQLKQKRTGLADGYW